MKKVFITGGSGFLGKHLQRRLKDEMCYEIDAPSSKDCNWSESQIGNKYTDIEYDYIIHLAAWTQAGDFCLYHPGEQWIKNQKINTNILDWWCTSQKSAKLVFMGTSCSYSPSHDLIEENYLKGEPIKSLYTYAMTKRMLHIGAESINRQYGLDYLCVVPSTLYGNDYHDDGRQMHFIFDLVRKIYNASKGGETPILWGDGSQKREIIHVDDFIDALLVIMETSSNEIINIGAGMSHTIKDFAKRISNICNYDYELIEFDESKYVGAKSKCLNIDKLLKMYPEFKNRELDLGLTQIIEWYSLSNRFKGEDKWS